MKKILLHIGAHKTGSSSIQQSLSQARKALSAKNINFIDCGSNHSDLFLCFCANPHQQHANIDQGNSTLKQAVEFAQQRLKNYLQALEDPTWETAIISGEELSRLEYSQLIRLKQQLTMFAGQIQIVCYVREPIAFSTSYAQESMLGGNLYQNCLSKPELPEYRKKLENFINAFGRDNVTVINFDDIVNGPDTLIGSFCRATGLEDALEVLEESHTNGSLPLEGALLLDKINQLYPVYVNSQLNLQRAKIPRSWFADIGQSRFTMPSDWQMMVAEQCHGDLQWLEQYFSIHFKATQPCNKMDSVIEALNEQPYWLDLAHLIHNNALKLNQLVGQNLTLLSDAAQVKGDHQKAQNYRDMIETVLPTKSL